MSSSDDYTSEKYIKDLNTVFKSTGIIWDQKLGFGERY